MLPIACPSLKGAEPTNVMLLIDVLRLTVAKQLRPHRSCSNAITVLCSGNCVVNYEVFSRNTTL